MKIFLSLLLSLICSASADDLKGFSPGYTAFTANVYKELLKSNSGNFIVCPLSTDIVLALVNSGAKGQTAKEISTALRLPENPEIFKSLSSNLRSSPDRDLTSANKVYVQDGFEVSDGFKKRALDIFDAEIQEVEFKKSGEAAAEINRWVEDKTRNKIKDLVKPDMLDGNTRAVLVNAVYFHGKWAKAFDPRYTVQSVFHLDSLKNTKVDMMYWSDEYEYHYSSKLNAKFLKLDYVGGDVSMHIVLPNDVEGLPVLEEKIEEVLVPPKYGKVEVEVSLPKFTIENRIKFKPILQNMGVQSAFGDAADFSGIGTGQLKISEVVQKAFIEVEETGTTAAAASAVSIVLDSLSTAEVFRADHPFLFYLRLNKPGINFFIGRYKSP